MASRVYRAYGFFRGFFGFIGSIVLLYNTTCVSSWGGASFGAWGVVGLVAFRS